MIGYNLALPGNRAFTGLEALRPAVWNALRNLNATKEDKDIPDMTEVVDLEDKEKIPEMGGETDPVSEGGDPAFDGGDL